LTRLKTRLLASIQMNRMNKYTFDTVTLSFCYYLLLVTVVLSVSASASASEVLNTNTDNTNEGLFKNREITITPSIPLSTTTPTTTRELSKCPQDEKYETCNAGPCDEDTCSSLASDDELACATVCQSGCICINDYVRDEDELDGRCYPVDTCGDLDAKIAYQARRVSGSGGKVGYGEGLGRRNSFLCVVLTVVWISFGIL
jgi:hypothetical protein